MGPRVAAAEVMMEVRWAAAAWVVRALVEAASARPRAGGEAGLREEKRVASSVWAGVKWAAVAYVETVLLVEAASGRPRAEDAAGMWEEMGMMAAGWVKGRWAAAAVSATARAGAAITPEAVQAKMATAVIQRKQRACQRVGTSGLVQKVLHREILAAPKVQPRQQKYYWAATKAEDAQGRLIALAAAALHMRPAALGALLDSCGKRVERVIAEHFPERPSLASGDQSHAFAGGSAGNVI